MAMTARKAEGMIFLAAAIWGLSFIFTFWGTQSCPPAMYLLLRCVGALILTVLVFGRHLLPFDRETLRQGLALGGLFCGGYLLQAYSIRFTTTSHASFIAAMTLPATPFVTWLVLRRKVARWSVIGVVIALAGLFVLLNPFANWSAAGDFPTLGGLYVGDWIGIASVPFWAFYLNYMDVFTRNREGRGATGKMLTMQFGTAIPILFVVWFVLESGHGATPPEALKIPVPVAADEYKRAMGIQTDEGEIVLYDQSDHPARAVLAAAQAAHPAATVSESFAKALDSLGWRAIRLTTDVQWGDRWLWITLAYNSVLASFVLVFLQTYAQRYTTPVKAVLLFQFEPIVATAAAIAVGLDVLTPLMALGAAIIILGVLASELGEQWWSARRGTPRPDGDNDGDRRAADPDATVVATTPPTFLRDASMADETIRGATVFATPAGASEPATAVSPTADTLVVDPTTFRTAPDGTDTAVSPTADTLVIDPTTRREAPVAPPAREKTVLLDDTRRTDA